MRRVQIQYALSGLLLAGVVMFLARGQYLALFGRVSALDWAVSAILALAGFLCSGWITALLMRRLYRVRLAFADLVTLPVAMNLWNILLPFRGGFLYFLLLVRSKYGIPLSGGSAMGIFTSLMTVVLVGGVGLAGMLQRRAFNLPAAVVFLIFLLSPWILMAVRGRMPVVPADGRRWRSRLGGFIRRAVEGANRLWSDPPAVGAVLAVVLLRLASRIAWTWWAARSFHLDVPAEAVVAFTLALEITNLVRVLPDNLGINELVGGGVLSVLDQSAGNGMMLALFIRAGTFLLTFTLGVWATMVNRPNFKMSGLRSLWSALKGSPS